MANRHDGAMAHGDRFEAARVASDVLQDEPCALAADQPARGFSLALRGGP